MYIKSNNVRKPEYHIHMRNVTTVFFVLELDLCSRTGDESDLSVTFGRLNFVRFFYRPMQFGRTYYSAIGSHLRYIIKFNHNAF